MHYQRCLLKSLFLNSRRCRAPPFLIQIRVSYVNQYRNRPNDANIVVKIGRNIQTCYAYVCSYLPILSVSLVDRHDCLSPCLCSVRASGRAGVSFISLRSRSIHLFPPTFIVVTSFATVVSSLLITWRYHERRFWVTCGDWLNRELLIAVFHQVTLSKSSTLVLLCYRHLFHIFRLLYCWSEIFEWAGAWYWYSC